MAYRLAAACRGSLRLAGNEDVAKEVEQHLRREELTEYPISLVLDSQLKFLPEQLLERVADASSENGHDCPANRECYRLGHPGDDLLRTLNAPVRPRAWIVVPIRDRASAILRWAASLRR